MKHSIICTLGPASLNAEIIHRLEKAGVTLFRINLSHTPIESIVPSIETIRAATQLPICLDSEGAQIRNRYMQGDKVFFKEGLTVTLTEDPILGTQETISLTPSRILDKLLPGDLLTIDFNSLLLKIGEKKGKDVTATVVCSGEAGSNKAVTVINRTIDLDPMTPKDQKAIELGLKHGIEWFALSFAGCGADVQTVKKASQGKMKIISKVESKRGLANLQDIIRETDAILIDRGDLSREVAIEKVPFWQKTICKLSNAQKKPVYVATNLLESMVTQSKPTRAEINDVVNTLMDGASGLVLAAETAIGKFPVACAQMIGKTIKNYEKMGSLFDYQSLLNSEDVTYGLPEPHGGSLINRLSLLGKNLPEWKNDPAIEVDETVLIDAEQIAVGTFSPLTGFMTRIELESVLKKNILPNGLTWTMPILFPIPQTHLKNSFKSGDWVMIKSNADQKMIARMLIEDQFSYDLNDLANNWFGTTDPAHPGVKRVQNWSGKFLGGKIDLLQYPKQDLRDKILTPAETRKIFETKGWTQVVGFHTRNVAHRGHEHLLLESLAKIGIDGLMVHPVVGPKKEGDFSSPTLLRAYQKLLDGYPKEKVMLGGFHTYSRFAGPREAVFTAICRKNFGCSHFIVGRDHTGVGSFYSPDSSQKIFGQVGDLGIAPLFYGKVMFCKACGKTVESCKHGESDWIAISGTSAREFFTQGQLPPAHMMDPKVAQMISEEIRSGKQVFIA